MNKYRMYIDEVGNADLKNANEENHRFLSLSGVVLDLDYVKEILFPNIENLKTKFFGSHPDEPIILHRKEIVNGKYPFEKLKDENVRSEFNLDLLELIKNTDFTLFTIVIDKKDQNEMYAASWKFDPYHYCLSVLIERYFHFLNRKNTKGDVMAESRGGKEDIRLKRSFHKLFLDGTSFVKASDFQSVLTSSELKIKSKSNNIAGLQLCDLIAHPSRREILIENKKIIDLRKDIFGDKVSAILQEKYDNVGGKIYGKKLLP